MRTRFDPTRTRDIALQAMALPPAGEALAEWLPLVPLGRIVGRDGREFVLDEPDQVVAHFSAQRKPIVFDYEHGSELLAKGGHEAPASGWVEELAVRDDAIWGRVEWTERARAAIQSREYRYYSPGLIVDINATPQRVLGIKSVGLTNNPNLYVPSLNHQQPETAMLHEAIRQALGLNNEATVDDAVAAIGSIKGERDTALNRAATPSLELFVPRADYNTALHRATTAEQALADERKAQADAAIEAAISQALEGKKITPATVEYHRAQCATEGGLERFRAFVEQAPVIAADTQLNQRQPGTGAQVDPQVAHVAKLLGKPVELFKQQ